MWQTEPILSEILPDTETGNALRLLAEHGSDLSKPLEMDFFVSAPNEEAAQAVAELAMLEGFATVVEFDEGEDLENREEYAASWTCYCTKIIVPTYDTVTSIEERLDALARPLGAYADGFGSFGNKPGEH